MGADAGTTLGDPLGNFTVMLPTSKLGILNDSVIMGVSGDVGMGQLYRDCIQKASKDGGPLLKARHTTADVQRAISQAIGKDAEAIVTQGNRLGPPYSNQTASQSLIALPVGGPKGSPALIECNSVGWSTAATDDRPNVAIGSGQQLADPFLAFVQRILWRNNLPTLAQGIFAAVWTLTQTIAMSPGLLSEPIQIAVLIRKTGGELEARMLSDKEIDGHRQNVQSMEQHLASYGKPPSAPSSTPPKP